MHQIRAAAMPNGRTLARMLAPATVCLNSQAVLLTVLPASRFASVQRSAVMVASITLNPPTNHASLLAARALVIPSIRRLASQIMEGGAKQKQTAAAHSPAIQTRGSVEPETTLVLRLRIPRFVFLRVNLARVLLLMNKDALAVAAAGANWQIFHVH